ncbi:MAG: peptidoglycan-binding domain-containing protein, partial [Bradyrhizobium sp.]|uniref:peptidoglycan-binding domain-containing protein n=1 Tax=Bradyrhizobium sp. TaxID=376 RepID=UPI0027319619
DGASANATRNLTAGIDPKTFDAEANQTTEDQIGLDKGQRRDVQRRLNGLGFDTKVTGIFNESTRSVITRWQAARGYPKSGYLNKFQHKALLTEIVATTPTAASDGEEKKPVRRAQQQQQQQRSSGGGGGGGGGGHRGGDPGAAFVGGVVGGMLGGAFRR